MYPSYSAFTHWFYYLNYPGSWCNVTDIWKKEIVMASNQGNTRGGSSEQHAKAGSQSHKNQGGSGQGSGQGSSGTRGGSSEQHAKAGSQSHKND